MEGGGEGWEAKVATRGAAEEWAAEEGWCGPGTGAREGMEEVSRGLGAMAGEGTEERMTLVTMLLFPVYVR